MSNQADKCCCGGGNNHLAKLDELLAHYQGVKGALIPVLQEAQNIYGYLPKDVIKYIGQKMSIPTSQIYGVVTFYAQFHLTPRGKNIIRVCMGTACHVRGAKGILTAIEEELQVAVGKTTPDLKFTIESVACIGACGLAPVIMVNDDTHGRLTPDRIPEILAKYA
jgi:NADH-quinone oxidoreductase E subunit